MLSRSASHITPTISQPLSKAQASLPTYCTSQTFSCLIFLGWYLTRDAALPVAGRQGNQSLGPLAQGGRAGLGFEYPMPGGRSSWNCCGCTRTGTSLPSSFRFPNDTERRASHPPPRDFDMALPHIWKGKAPVGRLDDLHSLEGHLGISGNINMTVVPAEGAAMQHQL